MMSISNAATESKATANMHARGTRALVLFSSPTRAVLDGLAVIDEPLEPSFGDRSRLLTGSLLADRSIQGVNC